MFFHHKHFHDTFKLCKILHEKKITAVENESRRKCIHIYLDHYFLQQMAQSKPYKKLSICSQTLKQEQELGKSCDFI